MGAERDPARVRGRVILLLVYVVLSALAVVALGPTLWVVVASFSTMDQIYSGTVIPRELSLDGYETLFANANLVTAFGNTLLYATMGTLGALASGFLAAYPTVRMRFPGRTGVVYLFSAALAVPILALLVPEYFVLSRLGLYDSKLGMVIFYSALFFPLAFVILRAYLSRMPVEIEESARVEGAGYFTILARMVVPLMRPALATVGIIVFISIWNEFLFNLALAPSPANENLQIMLSTFRGQFAYEITAMLAGTVVVMAVPVAAFLLLQRQVMNGLTAGAVK
ncbi:MAG: carbohydrate ABC transporter permease [Chloroflexi bacterium]|nr:carbohydrate ABC transporter permease [Chloroflexota bacterium]